MANTKIPSELIADSSITAAKLADGTITTADIADVNVTTAKIADSNVTTAKIGDAQVTTAKITDANVTTVKIADDAVTTAKMASNSVTSDTIASGITLAGLLTVDGGIDVDNFHLDGTTLALSSGDLTLDAAGYIALNADNAGTVIFEDASLQYLVVENISSDAVFRAGVQDKDMLFKGNDNGSTITALTLDMSDAGTATFNNNGTFGGTLGVTGVVTANAGINVDALNIDGRTIASTDTNGNINILPNGTGKVGIGDNDPFSKLHVEDTSWSSGSPYGTVLSVTGNNVNDNNWGHLIVTDSSTANGNGGSIRFGTGTADSSNLNPFAGIQGVAEGTSYGGLALYTRPSGGTATSRMEINSAGKVGIGTAATNAGLRISQPTTSEWAMNVIHSASGGVNYGLSVDTSAGAANTVGAFQVYTPSGGGFMVNNYSRVGIGTTSPRTLLHASASAQNQTQIGNCRQFSLTDSAGYDATRVEMGMGYWHPTHTYQPVVLGAIITDDGGQPVSDFYIATKSSTDGDDAPIERFRITKDGKTGIGTTNPVNFVDIIRPDGGDAALGIKSSSAGDPTIHFDSALADRSAVISFKDQGTQSGFIKYHHNGNRMQFGSESSSTVSMTIKGENVGIGEPTPHERLHVTGASGNTLLLHMDADTAGGTNILGFKNDSTNDDRRIKAGIIFRRDDRGTRGTGALHICVNGVNSDTNVSVSDSKMKFDAGGEISITKGRTNFSAEEELLSPGSHNGHLIDINGQSASGRAATNTQTHRSFLNPNGTVGTISTNGSATAYNTSSDYRLKENVVTNWDGTTLLKQLKPSKFNFKTDASTTVHGFLAHEVSSIVPEAVTGEKDAVYTAEEAVKGLAVEGQPKYQGIDQAKLVPLLVKTIQELEARITTLEG